MNYNDFAKELCQLISKKKETAFIKGYNATDAEALGILIAQYFDWDGKRILETAKWALEDANYHESSAEVDAMINNL